MCWESSRRIIMYILLSSKSYSHTRTQDEMMMCFSPFCITLALQMTQESFGRNLLMKQFKELSKTPVEGFSVGLIDDDIYKWRVLLEGPEDTPYEGGFFQCALIFPKSYPNSPPDFYFPHYFWVGALFHSTTRFLRSFAFTLTLRSFRPTAPQRLQTK